MLDLFKYGELLLAVLEDIGDFLLVSIAPINPDLISSVSDLLLSLGFSDAANIVSGWYYPDISFAGILFGSGVLTLLVVRFIKFFTDLVGL